MVDARKKQFQIEWWINTVFLSERHTFVLYTTRNTYTTKGSIQECTYDKIQKKRS